MNAELTVLKFLRDAAMQVRRRSDAAVAKVALRHEERLQAQIDKLEAELREASATTPEPAAA